LPSNKFSGKSLRWKLRESKVTFVIKYSALHNLTIQTDLKCFMWNVCKFRYECAWSLYNGQRFLAENINTFSTIVTFMLFDQEKTLVLLVTVWSKFILNNSNLYVDRLRKGFSIFINSMIYPVQKFSNGVEDTSEKVTFSSNNLPLHVLHGNKIAVF